MAGDTFDAGTVYAGARLDRDEFQRDLRQIRADLTKFEKQQWRVPIQADLDTRRARDELGRFTKQPRTVKADLTLGTEQAKRQYATFKQGLTNPSAELSLDTKRASAEYASFKSAMGPMVVPVELDTKKAERDLAGFRSRASSGRNRFQFKIDLDVAGALSKLMSFRSMLGQIAAYRVRPHIDIDVGSAVAGLAKVIALVTTLGGLAGSLGGLAGALGGVGAAALVAAGGIAPVILAFSGVGKALSAMSDAQKSAASDARAAAKQQASAAYAVESAHGTLRQAVVSAAKARRDAVRSVQSAEQQAARSIESALQQQASAQRQLVTAQREARRAQQDLSRAWEEGKRALQDLQDQLDMSMLDMEQAQMDLADAQRELNEARARGNSDEIARADLAYRRQLETVDQLGKRTNRLHEDNAKGQAAGVAGTEQYQSAMEQVRSTQESLADAERQAAQASRDVERARQDGIKAVAEAREQAQEQIAAADARVLEAQRALTQATRQFQDAGTTAADKVAEAFAGLSPAAADFARYLFSLKPLLDQLSATAATNFFPPLREGMDTLLTRMPEIDRVIGQLGAAMGQGLKLVLTTLANPYWSSFFAMIGDASGTVIPRLFQSLMTLGYAAAEIIRAFLPFHEVAFGVLDALSLMLAALAGPLAQALNGMAPAAHAFIQTFGLLGPLLVALSPALNALGVAFSQILGAALQALVPILQALTPFLVHFAQTLATNLVGAIQAATPFLVGLATFMSEHPGLVMGVVGALLAAIPVFNALGAVFSMLFTPIAALRLLMLATGLSFAQLAAPIAAVQGFLARLLAPLFAAVRVSGVFSTMMRLAGQAVMFIGRAILTALGPIGWLLLALGTAYTTSAPFRDALNGIFAILGQIVSQLASAVMPIFNTLGQVFGMLAGVVGSLVGALAAALVPVLNMVAGVLSSLLAAILPPLMTVVAALVPVIQLLAQVFLQLVMAVVGPLIGALQGLISAVLPPLVMILQNVIIPVIQFLAGLFAGVLAFAITNVLVPALSFLAGILGGVASFLGDVLAWTITNLVIPAFNFLVPIFQAVGAAAMWLWTNVIQPFAAGLGVAFEAIGTAAMWLWENAIKPAFDFIGQAARVLIAIIMTVLITPLLIAWNVVSAAAMWLWEHGIKPAFQAIGDFIKWVWESLIRPALDALVWLWQNVVAPAAIWLWENVLKPTFQAIGDFIVWVWTNMIKPALDALVWLWQNVLAPAAQWLWNTIIRPVFQAIGDFIAWVWETIIKPAFDAVVRGLDWLGENFVRVTDWIRDIWNRIRGYLAKPINFMIDVVWNKGVVPAWNAVAGLVGLGPIAPLPLIPEAATGGFLDDPSRGGTRAAGGGMLSGPGSGTSDSILGIHPQTRQATAWVSDDEFVVRAAVAQRVPHFLQALNSGQVEAMQAAGGSGAKMPGFGAPNMGRRQVKPLQALAGGGPVLQASIDRASAFARGESGKPYQWGGVGNPSWDCSGFMSGITNALNNRPVRSRLGTTATMPWGGFAPGLHSAFTIGNTKSQGHMAGTLAGVNVESGGSKGVHYGGPAIGADHGMFNEKYHLPVVGGDFASGGGGGGGGSWILDKMREVFDSLTNPAIDMLRGLVGEPPPEWRRVPPALAVKMRDTVRDFIFGKAPADAGGGGVDISGISGPVVEQVRQVAHRYGWGDGAEWNAIMQLVQKESSWNPNAANPTSSARGLFQKMTSLHGPVEPTAAGQANWGLNYIRGRYGTPTAAWSFHQANGHYDQGGELRQGLTMVQNMMPHSETVIPLPPDIVDNLLKQGQQAAFAPVFIQSDRVGDNVRDQAGDGESLVQLARAIATEVRDQAPLVGSIEVPTNESVSARDVADEVVFKLRSVKRGGVHAGRAR